jgi:hypothetical protein
LCVESQNVLSLGRRLPAPIAVTVAVIVRLRIVIGTGISVGLVMKIPKGAMIGAVLGTTIEAVLMGAFVRVRQLVVEPVVRVIAVVFVIIVSHCRHHGHAQYHGSR